MRAVSVAACDRAGSAAPAADAAQIWTKSRRFMEGNDLPERGEFPCYNPLRGAVSAETSRRSVPRQALPAFFGEEVAAVLPLLDEALGEQLVHRLVDHRAP